MNSGPANLEKALPGFEDIKRYWDPTRKCIVAKLLPGEIYVTKHAEVLTTVLGSCISACIWDSVMGVGGMNHFMLPLKEMVSDHDTWQDADYLHRYGNWAMEFLINEVLKNGGSKKNLKVKIFGGGKIMSSLTDVGEGNIQFAMEYLQNENLPLIAHDVGGPWPRKVMFFPDSGRAKIRKLQELNNDTIQRRESQYLNNITVQQTQTADIELF
ncbi:chemoreceptor glutamine deamidase CheD [Flocculibacter collagenilyticus]|uniref:chemoreceptor glutamine deamidase CheD n=1 Tax=Flocculibacter collagenilyticus TaxID=2744479 RepID=UPI0018F5D87A|nr:chemoreceptor glutamine deamidase CheD [Flocculibacter collagenilyticus]